MGQCAGLWVFIEVAGGPGWWRASEASSHPCESCTPVLENPSLGGRVQSRQPGRGAFRGAVQAGRGGGGKPDWLYPALPGSGGVLGAGCVSVGGVLFALVAWQLPGLLGNSLSCWQGLSRPVWKAKATDSLRLNHIPPSAPAGTLGPGAGQAGPWHTSGAGVGPLGEAGGAGWCGALRKTLF